MATSSGLSIQISVIIKGVQEESGDVVQYAIKSVEGGGHGTDVWIKQEQDFHPGDCWYPCPVHPIRTETRDQDPPVLMPTVAVSEQGKPPIPELPLMADCTKQAKRRKKTHKRERDEESCLETKKGVVRVW